MPTDVKGTVPQIFGVALSSLAHDLQTEFQLYEFNSRPPENPVFDHDMVAEYGPQLTAARLGYKFFPFGGRCRWHGNQHNPPEPTYGRIKEWWDADNGHAMIFASLCASEVVVVQISTVTEDGYRTLARLEELFGKLPRSRIVRAPESFDIHLRGRTVASPDSLGPGLTLLSEGQRVLLPHTRECRGAYRWLRVGALEAAPNWLLDFNSRSAK